MSLFDRATGRFVREPHARRDIDETGDERMQCDDCMGWFDPDDMNDSFLCAWCAPRERRRASVPPSGVCLICGYPTERVGSICLNPSCRLNERDRP